MTDSPGRYRRWVLAARPRTLPAAAVPVVVGATLIRPQSINWLNSLLCLVVALALQIGTNYANDYSDGVRGTDEVRVGPFRLTASKLVHASSVRNAAFTSFFVGALAGVVLASRTSWWLVAIGVTAVLAGWFYTGGPRPYGYFGFGELFVFIYFGMVATVGTAYVQHLMIPGRAWWLGAATGFMACALLEANNLRDVDGDQRAGKKTLAARLGRQRGSWLYGACVAGVVVTVAASGHPVVAIVAVLLNYRGVRLAFSSRTGRDLLPLLQRSAQAQLQVGAVLALVMAVNLSI
jgi:1,4-dihydroxy-2-naphthoate octaprenyltransferase